MISIVPSNDYGYDSVAMPRKPSCLCGECQKCLARRASARYRERNPERHRAAVKRWRENNYELALEREKAYRELNSDKIKENQERYKTNHPERPREASRRWRENNPERSIEVKRSFYQRHAERLREERRQYRINNPEKEKARYMLNNALQAGRITKGTCEVGQGCRGRIEGHHDDYSRPLEVRWLCQLHHAGLHC